MFVLIETETCYSFSNVVFLITESCFCFLKHCTEAFFLDSGKRNAPLIEQNFSSRKSSRCLFKKKFLKLTEKADKLFFRKFMSSMKLLQPLVRYHNWFLCKTVNSLRFFCTRLNLTCTPQCHWKQPMLYVHNNASYNVRKLSLHSNHSNGSNTESFKEKLFNNISIVGTMGKEKASLHLRNLMEFGFSIENIEELIMCFPTHFQSGKLFNISKNLYDFGFSVTDISSIFNLSPEFLDVDIESINKTLDTLRRFGCYESTIVTIVSKCPELVHKTEREIVSRFDQLKELFTRKELIQLVKSSPYVFIYDINDIISKYEYVTMEMGIPTSQIVKSNLFAQNVSHIKCRHAFLERAGFFKKTVKQKKGKLNNNPPLRDIVDTTDEVFAKQHGNMRKEDYKTFVRMFTEELVVIDSDNES